jgi:xanthine dehydrogenase YagS FAD-binding subunit
MKPFTYIAVTREGEAIESFAAQEGSAFLAGGTNLVDDMKLGVEQPQHLIDINRLPLARIESLADGGLRIGALVRNTELAYDDRVRSKFPALSQAILSGASGQLRNMATTAGNLLQRTRCYYFRDVAYTNCNKRAPGSGCAALEGFNRIHAILGTSEQCIATHPSDMDVALVAFDAVVRTQGPGGKGERVIPIEQFYVAYGDDPARENVLAKGELITAVDLPGEGFFARSHYLKVRDRASYEFALSSAAVALEVVGGTIKQARVALGGVATKPWRARAAEKALVGQKPSDETFAAAAAAELKAAVPRKYNAFKVELCRRTIVRALGTVANV